MKGVLFHSLETLKLAIENTGQDTDSRLCGKMKRILGLDGSFRANLVQLPSLHEETEAPGPTVSKLKSQE